MAITRLYDTCFEKIRQLRPQEHVSRVRNISRLMAGLFMSGCVHLSYIARKIPGTVQQASKIKMLSRILNNPHIRVRDWYEPIAHFNAGRGYPTGLNASKKASQPDFCAPILRKEPT